MTHQQVIELLKSGKIVRFNSSYFPVGYDAQTNKLFILSKHDNHVHSLTHNDLKNLTVE